jgi:hypothetical protein
MSVIGNKSLANPGSMPVVKQDDSPNSHASVTDRFGQPANLAGVATDFLEVADADAYQLELWMFDDLSDHHLADESATPDHDPFGSALREKFGHQPTFRFKDPDSVTGSAGI